MILSDVPAGKSKTEVATRARIGRDRAAPRSRRFPLESFAFTAMNKGWRGKIAERIAQVLAETA
jgi:hypothetical protein